MYTYDHVTAPLNIGVGLQYLWKGYFTIKKVIWSSALHGPLVTVMTDTVQPKTSWCEGFLYLAIKLKIQPGHYHGVKVGGKGGWGTGSRSVEMIDIIACFLSTYLA